MEIGQGQSIVISGERSTRDVISDLLISPFGIRNPTEPKTIVRMQQPRPKLQLMTRGGKFQQSWYTKKDWLCACETRNSLFCWPYLLCNSKSGRFTWSHAGYVIMHGFLRIARSMKGLSPTWSPTKCKKRSKMTDKKVWICCSPGLGGKLWKDTTRRSGKTERCLKYC